MKSEHKTPSLSVAIISRNEEARIAKCLESVRSIAKEIIVVDSGSTDHTVAIAESMGATVFTEEWKGFVEQRNSVLEKCTCEWVLFFDCDEVLSETLRKSIADAIKNDAFNGFKIEYVSFFMNRWIKHAWSQEWHTRLIKRGKAKWTGYDVSEILECQAPVGRLDGIAYHYTYINFEQHIKKGLNYAALGGNSLCKRGKKVRAYMLFANPVWCFIKHYIVKRGFLDGLPGFIISLTSMHHNFCKYMIAWEMQGKKSFESATKKNNND